MTDQYYTPPGLAALLVSASKVRTAKLVADFAMGDGALLRAAEARWPRTSLFGSDINPVAADAVHGLKQALSFEALDFLQDHERSAALAGLKQACDVILLNPPFTCRGNRRYPATVGGEVLHGSKALAFVCRALEYLKPRGEALAIVPASCATSERDRNLMTALRANYTVDQIGEINRNAFAGCTVNVIIIRIRRRSLFSKRQTVKPVSNIAAVKPYTARIMRGGTSVHRTSATPPGMPVLHTSDLRDRNLTPARWIAGAGQVIQGMAVLLPRVGRPDQAKLVVADLPELVLSDCVIAIQTCPPGAEQELLRLMRSRWAELELLYGGSCAPYITLGQLEQFLRQSGVVGERNATRVGPVDGAAVREASTPLAAKRGVAAR